MLKIILALFFSLNSYALTINDLIKDRGTFGEKEIELTGVIKKAKFYKRKYDRYYQFQIIDKFNKEYIKAKFYLQFNNEAINEKFTCLEGQIITIKGNFYAKAKGRNLGDLLVQKKVNYKCVENDSFKSLKKTYSLSELNTSRKKLNKSNIKVSGFVKNFRLSLSSTKTKASFNMVTNDRKLRLKVKVVISVDETRVLNDFTCKDGQSITLTGPYIANLKNNKNLGSINIFTKEDIKCDAKQSMVLTAKDKAQQEKLKIKEQKQRLNIAFKKFKKYYKSKKSKIIQKDFNAVYDEIKSICKEGIKNPKLNLKCVKISYFARAMEQRNQLSFRIQSVKNNFADWDKLKAYKLPYKHNILDMIKALYPANSDYIIGIPKRCFPDQQFNPSASNFPYRKLTVSKYARDNFTAILHKFNDPNLRCGSLMDSIFFIGNMDSDNDLEVIKIDLYSDTFYKIIKSDI